MMILNIKNGYMKKFIKNLINYFEIYLMRFFLKKNCLLLVRVKPLIICENNISHG